MQDVEQVRIKINCDVGAAIELRSSVGTWTHLILFDTFRKCRGSVALSALDARTLALMLIRLTQSAFPNAAPDDLDALRAEYLNFRQDMLDAMNAPDAAGSLAILLKHFELQKNYDGEGRDRLFDPRASVPAAAKS